MFIVPCHIKSVEGREIKLYVDWPGEPKLFKAYNSIIWLAIIQLCSAKCDSSLQW